MNDKQEWHEPVPTYEELVVALEDMALQYLSNGQETEGGRTLLRENSAICLDYLSALGRVEEVDEGYVFTSKSQYR